MIKVGAFEAKTHLSSLLDKVSNGEEVLITRHGKAVARLLQAEQADQLRVDNAISKLLALRKGIALRGLDWKVLRDEKRR